MRMKMTREDKFIKTALRHSEWERYWSLRREEETLVWRIEHQPEAPKYLLERRRQEIQRILARVRESVESRLDAGDISQSVKVPATEPREERPPRRIIAA